MLGTGEGGRGAGGGGGGERGGGQASVINTPWLSGS